jgi:hypothetical protein
MSSQTVGLSDKAQAVTLFAAFVLPALVNFVSVPTSLVSEAILAGAFLAGLVAVFKEVAGSGVNDHEQGILMFVAFLLAPAASLLATGSVSPYALLAGVLGGVVFAAKENIKSLSANEQGVLSAVSFIIAPVIPVLSGTSVSGVAVVTALIGGFLAYAKEAYGISIPVSSPSVPTAPSA